MFLNYSLIKDGAVVYCESAAEYDENMVGEIPEEKQEAIRAELKEYEKEHIEPYNPFLKLSEKLHPLLIQVADFDISASTQEERFDRAMELSALASVMVEEVRHVLHKMTSIYRAAKCDIFIYEPIAPYLKYLVEHRDSIAKDPKLSSVMMVQSTIPLYSSYEIGWILSYCHDSYMVSGEALLTLDNIRFITGNMTGTFITAFRDIGQFLRTVADPEMLSQYITENRITVDAASLIQDAIRNFSYSDGVVAPCRGREADNIAARYTKYVSMMLRKVKTSLMSCTSRIMDDPDGIIEAHYHDIMSGCLNAIQAYMMIGLLIMFNLANDASYAIGYREKMTEYAANLEYSITHKP